MVEVVARSFANLPILETVDLSDNRITMVESGTFAGVPHLRWLQLDKNQLSSFKGDVIATTTTVSSSGSDDEVSTPNVTELEHLDLSDNHLTYLYPESFTLHPNLKWLSLAKNRFFVFAKM